MANTMTKPMYYRGDWLMCANYSIGEVVKQNGALWLALTQNAGVDPDSAEGESCWALVGEIGGQGGGPEPGQLYHLTPEQLAAIRNANHPSGVNPFLTAADMPALEKRVAAFQMVERSQGLGALYAAAFGEDVFVTVGDKHVARSTDGRNWVAVVDCPDGYWRGVAHGGGVFAALGLGTDAMYSEDGGQTWTLTTAPEGEWNALAYGNGMFIGVCDGKIVKSLDGRTGWAAKAVPAGYGEDIAFGNGVFVAVGPAGALTSTDGETWTERETPRATWRCVEYGNGMFVALGGKCMVSTDGGQTWTLTPAGLPSGGWDAVCHGGGFFVGVGNSAQCIATMDTALEWTQTAAPNFIWRGLAYGLDMFVAVGSGIMTANVVDAAAAMAGAHAPSGTNAFATLEDLADVRNAVASFRADMTRVLESLTIEGEA